jgi:diguanylate cyclase
MTTRSAADRPPGGAAAAAVQTPAQLAKAALRRLAMERLEPTPENYAQAWAAEAGEAAAVGGASAASAASAAGEAKPPALPPRARSVFERLVQRSTDDPALREPLLQALLQGRWDDAQSQLERQQDAQSGQAQQWAQLIERLARLLERGSRQWTAARKKDSLQRVLDSSRSDQQRLLHRLKQLVAAWETEGDEPDSAPAIEPVAAEAPPAAGPGARAAAQPMAHPASDPPADAAKVSRWPDLLDRLGSTLHGALASEEPRALALATELGALLESIRASGPTDDAADAVEGWCRRARRLLMHRQHLVDQLHRLSQELAASLVELSEDDSWVHGQCQALQQQLSGEAQPPVDAAADAPADNPPADRSAASVAPGAPTVRMVRSASELLARTRARQRELRAQRDEARGALKQMIQSMLLELGRLDERTGRFSHSMLRYAETVERAETLESLATMVRAMVDESREVHGAVRQSQDRLLAERGRAVELESRVQTLEGELQRLSDEVGTDALTQVANRRGLMKAFEVERVRLDQHGGQLSIGLLDIDNFKRLNDSLGHAVGDQALVALAEHVRVALRPNDSLARFGGEEFVVLLPDTPVDEARQVLGRLQRSLTASLFMHENREVFVTFSAGVTGYRTGESMEAALERADEGLYEAKGSGKNRTCLG